MRTLIMTTIVMLTQTSHVFACDVKYDVESKLVKVKKETRLGVCTFLNHAGKSTLNVSGRRAMDLSEREIYMVVNAGQNPDLTIKTYGYNDESINYVEVDSGNCVVNLGVATYKRTGFSSEGRSIKRRSELKKCIKQGFLGSEL